jgi:hypothetical protein
MRCRGLTGASRATDLPIPRLVRTLPDRHLANSPYALPVPRLRDDSRGCPRRWPAVQVVNEFLLLARAGTQGLSVISSRFFCYPQHEDCYPPPSPLIHRIPTVFAQPPHVRPSGTGPSQPASRGGAEADVVLALTVAVTCSPRQHATTVNCEDSDRPLPRSEMANERLSPRLGHGAECSGPALLCKPSRCAILQAIRADHPGESP